MIGHGGGIPPTMTPGERADAAAAMLGVELLDWQREWLEALMRGERVVVLYRGRRGEELTTVRRVGTRIMRDDHAV